MILRQTDFHNFANYIRERKKHIVVYGAGLIGEKITPYLISDEHLTEYVRCFVDRDKRKQGKSIVVGSTEKKILSPDVLNEPDSGRVILITNSKFHEIISFLDRFDSLRNTPLFILPFMQVEHAASLVPEEIKQYSDIPLIPHVIHYCWFGGSQMTDSLKRCIDSWKRLCPDFDIVEWNEHNYDVNRHRFTREAFDNKCFAYLSDLARLDILYDNGGVYMDTDVTLLKNLDICTYQKGYIASEKWSNINSGGGCGFIKGHPMLKQIIEYRDRFPFVREDGSFNRTTNGVYETQVFLDCGYEPNNRTQVINDVTVYPSYVMHPYDYMSERLDMNESTISVHNFSGGWMNIDDLKNRQKTRKYYQNYKLK